MCDDYSGYKAGFGNGFTEICCIAHARPKFYDLHETNQSTRAAQAIEYIDQLYMIEREIIDLPPDKRNYISGSTSKDGLIEVKSL